MWSINRSVILGVAIAAGATGVVETCKTFGSRAVAGRAVGGVVLILRFMLKAAAAGGFSRVADP